MSTTKIHLFSDLHLDMEYDNGKKFLSTLGKGAAWTGNVHEDPLIAILAGDITTLRYEQALEHVLKKFLKIYPFVLYVPGNHEYWDTTPMQAKRTLDYVRSKCGPELSIFDEPHAMWISGQQFYCGTMWYRNEPDNWYWEQRFPDFKKIQLAKPFVYDENAKFLKNLKPSTGYLDFEGVEEGAIVVTHHLPCDLSVPTRYAGKDKNRFFVCDVSKEILQIKPKLWLHGHTHDDFDYMLGDTRVICHPRGRPLERLDWAEYKPFEIEIEDPK